MKPTLATTAVGLLFAGGLHAATHEISNPALTVRFDDAAGTLTLADKASGKDFLTNGKFDAEVTKAAVSGNTLTLTQKDGGTTRIELKQDQPFAFITKAVHNATSSAADFARVAPITFTVDLGKPAAELKTMGTGGLLAPDKNPGSYLFLTAVDPLTREGVVSGWVTQMKGSGTVLSSVNQGQVEFKAQTEHGHLIVKPGQSATLDTFAIGHFSDARLGEEAFASAVAKAHNIKLRPKTAVYCSWYAEGPGHGGAGTEANTVELAKFCAKEKLPEYGLGVLQIDDRWQDGPQIGGPATHFDRVAPNGPYKGGIAPVTKAVEKEGMTFGLWWLPFGRNHMEADYKDKQDWFWKWSSNGQPLRQKSFGGTCLDSSVPAVAQHLEDLGHLMRSWGVKYYKMDGLNAGVGVDHCYINDGYKEDGFGKSAPAHDPSLTNVEVMRKGLGHIRKGAGDEVFFSGCCAVQNMRTYAGTIGLVNSMRVGPDFNHDGQGIRSGPLRGSRMYFLNGKVWWNDPDPSKVRTSSEHCEADGSIDGAVTTEQAQLTTSWVSLSDQFFLLSDWIPNLPQERLDILKKTMASHGATTRPVDYFDRDLANTWLVSSNKSGVLRQVVGLFNFHGQPLKAEHTFAKVGLDPKLTYHAFDFWANQPAADLSGTLKETVEPMSCRVLSLRAAADHPVLISTSRHVSSGILEVEKEAWQDNALSGTSKVIGGDAYELRIVGLRDGGKQWTPSEVSVSKEDQAAGVTVAHTLEAGVLRVKITSKSSRAVAWKVRFTSGALQPLMPADLKATATAADEPVQLTWTSNASFHTILRDGQEIARGHYGTTFADEGAEPGKTHAYAVAVDNGQAVSAVNIAVPALPPAPPTPSVKLADVKPLEAVNGWGEVQTGKSVDGSPLTVGKQVFPAGLGLHAPARLTYTRDPKWTRFVAQVGLNEAKRTDGRTTLVCKVVSVDASGKESVLATSRVLRFGGVETFNVNAALPADCAKLRLVVEDAGDGIASDHVNWANAGFMQ